MKRWHVILFAALLFFNIAYTVGQSARVTFLTERVNRLTSWSADVDERACYTISSHSLDYPEEANVAL